MTKKAYEKIKQGSQVVKHKGDTIDIVHSGRVDKKEVDEDIVGIVTKIDPNFEEYAYVLWPGQTHSERIRYSELKEK